MKQIIPKMLCTGCAACVNSCSRSAIKMQVDIEGFQYPVISQQHCIDCKQCEKACPVKQKCFSAKKTQNPQNIRVYAVKSKLYSDRMYSSSGGFFPVIARYVLSRQGVVVGAAFDDNFDVKHIVITRQEDLFKLQGSKYVQSDVGNIYQRIKELLSDGVFVLFSGLACQVAGLKTFLRKNYTNLLCVDLICMGIPSPGVWSKYKRLKFGKENILYVNFKDKRNGWNKFTVAVDTDKRRFAEIGKNNEYMQCMFKSYSLRHSCFSCKFKSLQRLSDFTISDCWGIQNLFPGLDDNKGVSTAIIHTANALKIWTEIKDKFEYKEMTLDDVVKYNPLINHCVSNRRLGRNIFFFIQNKLSNKLAFYLLCNGWINSLRCIIGEKGVAMLGLFAKIIKRLSRFETWKLNLRRFHDLWEYDLKFNTSFRGGGGCYSPYSKSLIPEMKIIRLYRRCQAQRRTVWFFPLFWKLRRMGEKTGMCLYQNLNIGKGLIIGHAGTIILNEGTKFGDHIFLTHGVTIGRDIRGKRRGVPNIGNNVCIRANSSVVGNITIEDDVLIAPNSFVNFDVPSHSVVLGSPGTIHHRDCATEGHLGIVEE